MKKKIISIISVLAVSVSALTAYAVNREFETSENNPDIAVELAAENTLHAGVYMGDGPGMYFPIKQTDSPDLGNDLFRTFDDSIYEYYEELLSRGETHTSVNVSVELPEEGEIYFGYISDNNGYISEIPSEDGRFSEELDLSARGARVIIKYVSGEKEYYTHIILKDTPVTINEYDGTVQIKNFYSCMLEDEYGLEPVLEDLYYDDTVHEKYADFEAENLSEGVSLWYKNFKTTAPDGMEIEVSGKIAVPYQLKMNYPKNKNDVIVPTESGFYEDPVKAVDMDGERMECASSGLYDAEIISRGTGTFALVYRKKTQWRMSNTTTVENFGYFCRFKNTLNSGKMQQLNKMMKEYMGEDDKLLLLGISAYDEETNDKIDGCNADLAVRYRKPTLSGGRAFNYLGKDYRAYRIEGNEIIPLEIKDSDLESVCFKTDTLGDFAVIYNGRVYKTILYSNMLCTAVDEDGNEVDIEPEIFKRIENVAQSDTVLETDIPQKDGYVFCGWGYRKWDSSFIHMREGEGIAGSWEPLFVSEEEYKPYTVTLKADKMIYAGKEDGAVIYLSVSDGRFKESFLTSPEEYGKAVLNESCGAGIPIDVNEYWSQLWMVSGAEGVSVGRVERMDDKTLKLTLAGSSDNKSKELSIAFDREEYMDDDYWYEEFGVEDEADGTLHFGRYQLNTVGQVAAMYSSDNSIKIYKKSSGGGGGSVRTTPSPKPEVTAAPEVTTQPQETAVPEKKSITVSTEDGRVKISVNGVPVVYSENEPFIDDNNRTQLPIRAVMETLGAEVEWNEADKSVKITYGGDEIILKIGSNVLLINGKERIMDTSAVIIKDSTYIPLRAVAEALRMEVVWK